jgi:CBS domain-containing protein
MRAGDLMSGPAVRSVAPEDSLAYAAEVMVASGVRHLPVLRGPELVGMLSERDVLRRGAELGGRGAAPDSVGNAMTHPAITVGPDEPIAAAAALMFGHKIGCVPVVQGGIVLGVLTTTDILRHELYGGTPSPNKGEPLPVGALMRSAPATIRTDAPVADAARLMAKHGLHHLPVVDGDHRVVGLLNDADIGPGKAPRFREAGGPQDEGPAALVGDVMIDNPVTIEDVAPLREAAERLLRAGAEWAPVVNGDGRLVGLLTLLDLVNHLR